MTEYIVYIKGNCYTGELPIGVIDITKCICSNIVYLTEYEKFDTEIREKIEIALCLQIIQLRKKDILETKKWMLNN